jgi:hypothetical protein
MIITNQRQGVADHRIRGFQAQLGAVGQQLHFEGAAEHAHDVGMLVEDVGVRPSLDRLRLQLEQPSRLVVEEDNAASAVHGQHTVAHISHHVAEKHVELPGRMSRWLGHQHQLPSRNEQSPCPERQQRLNALSRCDYIIWIMP